MRNLKITKTERLQDICREYMQITKATKINMKEVAAWAIQNGKWEASRKDAIKQCTHELSRAARDESYTDPQGRRVRKMHAVRQVIDDDGQQKQMVLWADIENAPPEHMHLSFQQRRGYITGDCKQLKTDLDSFNQNNSHGVELELSFDFREDLEEMDMPSEYSPE